METISVKKNNSIRTQVARSKGTEWMVSNYNAWQLRSPLKQIPQRNPSTILHVVSRMAQRERQLQNAAALSFKSIVFIIGIILSFKGR